MNRTANLNLRGETVEQLRALARRFTELDPERIGAMDTNALISELSREPSTALQRELGRRKVSIKPSFYLMSLAAGPAPGLSADQMKRKVRAVMSALNEQIKRRKEHPSRKAFNLESLEIGDGGVIECQYTWQSIIWYWAADTVTLENIYEFKVGYVMIAPSSRKALSAST